MTDTNYSIRPLTTQPEFEECAALQREVWGISEAEAMSSITMHALAMAYPRTGQLLGGFCGEQMVALMVCLAAFEPRTGYGHMLGVLPSHRDAGLGRSLMEESIKIFRDQGGRWYCFTFDPLESRNSHLYLNRQGARGIRFKPDAYGVSGAMHGGLPMDRLLARIDLEASPQFPPPGLEQALQKYPIAVPDRMPEDEAVLVEIPVDIAALREENHEAALAASRSARLLFTEYITERGMVSCALVRGKQEGQPRSFHLLKRQTEQET
jgi:predicted GNAT superfamily acetyltransferase